jgi:DNA-binding MarR family transcriptional regulator
MHAETTSADNSRIPAVIGAAVRRLARALAIASRSRDLDSLTDHKIALSKLTAGLDPKEVDRASPEFRFGAAEALGTVLNGLAEQMLSGSTTHLLGKSQRARVLAGIAAHSGSTQKELAGRLSIKESNLSQYLRELGDAGLVEPAVSSRRRGKAWALSPWGLQAFFAITSGPVAALVPAEELTEAMSAARARRGEAASAFPHDERTISKDETYQRIDDALSVQSDRPVLLTTLYTGDVRTHKRPWSIHQRVVEDGGICRPVKWILAEGPEAEPWQSEFIKQATGNHFVSIWKRARPDDPTPTVQVLDDAGLFYPIAPDDAGLVRSRADGLAAWNQMFVGARPLLVDGHPPDEASEPVPVAAG